MVYLSPSHGVNPSLECCFFCNEPKGVALLGRLSRHKARKMLGEEIEKGLQGHSDDVEAPSKIVLDKMPCEKCVSWMEKGIIFISVRNGEEGDNPHRTGGWVVVVEDFVRRTFKPAELVNSICEKRVAFLPDETWDFLRLPRGSMEGVPSE